MLVSKIRTRTLYLIYFLLCLFVIASVVYYSRLLALKILEYNKNGRSVFCHEKLSLFKNYYRESLPFLT